jgi:hypothetical protein
MLGPLAVSGAKSKVEDKVLEDSNTVCELDTSGKLEEAKHQLISETITFAFTMQSVVPLLGISKENFRVYMYDPDEDLLYESTTIPLFVFPVEGRQLHITSIIALWMIVNFDHFFTGVKCNQIEFGYKADLNKFLDEYHCDIYKHHLRIGGLRHVKSKHSKEAHAGMDMGKFNRLISS